METSENITVTERIVRFTAGLLMVLGSLYYDINPDWLLAVLVAATYACISAMTGYDLVKGLFRIYRTSHSTQRIVQT